MKNRKPYASCPLNRLSRERAEEITEYAETNTLSKTVAWLASRGLKTSESTVCRWLSGRRLREFFLKAEVRVNRLRECMSKSFPEFNERELDRRANIAFQLEAMERLDPKTYLAFATARHKLRMDHVRFAHDREKWQASRQTKIEAGLHALNEEARDNPEATELLQKFKAVATKATT